MLQTVDNHQSNKKIKIYLNFDNHNLKIVTNQKYIIKQLLR